MILSRLQLLIISAFTLTCLEGLVRVKRVSQELGLFGSSKCSLIASACGVVTSLAILLVPTSAVDAKTFPACVTDSNPQTTVVSCRQLGLKDDGRLLGCQANENCFSTSATSATKYSSPWKYYAQDTEQAWSLLRAAVENQGLKVLQADAVTHYMLAAEKGTARQGQPQPAGSSLFYEFLLKPDEKLVLYRAVVDKTVFVYPLQQPVTDFGVLKDRLKGIISKTGWTTVAAIGEGDDTMDQKIDSAKQSLWNVFI